MAEEATTTAATETTQATTTETAETKPVETAQAESLLKSEAKSEEAKTETEGAKTETQTEKKDEKAGAPEKYEFKAPDGTTLDMALLGKFEPLLKEANIPQELAQKFVDVYASARADEVKNSLDAWQKQQSDWLASVKVDKEFGGPALDANLRASNAAYNKFFTEAERKEIETYGLGNFPPLLKALSRVGKLMSEDKFVNGSASTAAKDPAQVMYPTMVKP